MLVIVPADDEPPTTPSTDQVILPLALAAWKCCVSPNVTTEAFGVTEKPAVVALEAARKATICMTHGPDEERGAVAL